MRDDDIVSNTQGSKIKDSEDLMGFSQHSYIQDELTKQRILDGTVYFCESVWASLRNGTCSACVLALSLHDNRQSFCLVTDLYTNACSLSSADLDPHHYHSEKSGDPPPHT